MIHTFQNIPSFGLDTEGSLPSQRLESQAPFLEVRRSAFLVLENLDRIEEEVPFVELPLPEENLHFYPRSDSDISIEYEQEE